MINGPAGTIKLARKLRSEMSLPEMVLWRQLRERPGGFKFRRQHPAGRYVLDFYCAAIRLAIEVDGATHDGFDAARHDAARSTSIRSQHVATLRIPATAVLHDIEAVILRIGDVCRTRSDRIAAWRGSETPHVPLHQPAAGPPPRSGEEQDSI